MSCDDKILGRTHGQTDRQTDGPTDGQTDGVTALLDLLSPLATRVKTDTNIKDEQKYFNAPPPFIF